MEKKDDNHGVPESVAPEEAGRFEKPFTLPPLKSAIENLALTQRPRIEGLDAPTVVLDRHKVPIVTLLDNVTPLAKEEIERQYADEIHLLFHYGFVGEKGEARPGDTPLPPPATVSESFTDEERKLATTITNPTLLLVPDISFVALKRIIEEHIKRVGVKNSIKEGVRYITSNPDGLFEQQDPTINSGDNIRGWRALITGDPLPCGIEDPDMKERVLKRTFKDKVRDWQNNRHKGMRGIGRNEALYYMLKRLKCREIPLTKKDIILLDGEFPTNSEVLKLREQLNVDIDDIILPPVKFIAYKRMAGGVFLGSGNCFNPDGELYDTLLVPVIGGNKLLK